MRTKQLESIIEAILFTMGDSVEVSKIASAIEQDVPTTEKLIHNMMDKYQKEERGIRIIELDQDVYKRQDQGNRFLCRWWRRWTSEHGTGWRKEPGWNPGCPCKSQRGTGRTDKIMPENDRFMHIFPIFQKILD